MLKKICAKPSPIRPRSRIRETCASPPSSDRKRSIARPESTISERRKTRLPLLLFHPLQQGAYQSVAHMHLGDLSPAHGARLSADPGLVPTSTAPLCVSPCLIKAELSTLPKEELLIFAATPPKKVS